MEMSGLARLPPATKGELVQSPRVWSNYLQGLLEYRGAVLVNNANNQKRPGEAVEPFIERLGGR